MPLENENFESEELRKAREFKAPEDEPSTIEKTLSELNELANKKLDGDEKKKTTLESDPTLAAEFEYMKNKIEQLIEEAEKKLPDLKERLMFTKTKVEKRIGFVPKGYEGVEKGLSHLEKLIVSYKNLNEEEKMKYKSELEKLLQSCEDSIKIIEDELNK